MDKEICKGCQTYEDNVCMYSPKIKRNEKELFCPCIICLIKGMCTDACDVSLEYDSEVKNDEWKNNRILLMHTK